MGKKPYVISTFSGEKGELPSARLVGSSGGGGGGSVTAAVKDALLDCFANVAWATEDGQQYYDALEVALYPLNYIRAVYTQSGTVYDTDSLDNLKADLVVTAFYQGGGSKAVTGYTLSGTLTEGTSTITVSYGGETTTFDVAVTHKRYLIELTNSDFIIANNNPSSGSVSRYPYYYTINNSRYSYVLFDLRLSGGKKYKFTATVNYQTAQLGCQFYNETVANAVQSQSEFALVNIYDPGWQALSTEINVPETVNNSNTVGVRVTLRQSTSNPDIANDFEVTSLTVEEVAE